MVLTAVLCWVSSTGFCAQHPQPKQLPATFINRTVDDGINQRNVLIPLNDQDLATLPDQAAIAVALSDEVVVSGQVVTGSTTSGQADEKQSQN